MAENEDYTIDTSRSKSDCLNYQLLREYGLEYIQRMGSKVWTDYNLHDPGVTIFELLCYALTDLGYRTSFDINDILTPEGAKGPETSKAFYPADKILTSHPVTAVDYRKLILGTIPRIRNVWLRMEHGIYKVFIDLEDGALNDAAKYTDQIRELLMDYRNLCEDFGELVVLKPIYVGISTVIEIDPAVSNYEFLLVEILKLINDYIAPPIRFYTEEQLLGKDKKPEDIYEGAISPGGKFVDKDELTGLENRKILYASDFINLIMNIEGVKNVQYFDFKIKEEYKNRAKDEDDVLINIYGYNIESDIFSIELNKSDEYSFRFFTDIHEINENNEITFIKGLHKKKVQIEDQTIKDVISKPKQENDIEKPETIKGRYRHLNEYISIQDDFPRIYKTGREGISDRESSIRKAQRLQLKAYLLFFDQLLADYLEQLNAVKNLLSWNNSYQVTYPVRKLTGNEVSDFNVIFSSYNEYQSILEPEELRFKRKNRFLNHLLARFNEDFVNYSMMTFDVDDHENIRNKIAFLDVYPEISGARSHAFNYTKPLDNTNYTVLERRILHYLGINESRVNQYLAPELIRQDGTMIIFKDHRDKPFDELFGIHIYEHIIWRTKPQENSDIDLTVVVPNWLPESDNEDFRNTIEQKIRTEIPAHAGVMIYWIDPLQMKKIEDIYKNYLNTLPERSKGEEASKHEKALDALLKYIKDMHEGNNHEESGWKFDTSINLK